MELTAGQRVPLKEAAAATLQSLYLLVETAVCLHQAQMSKPNVGKHQRPTRLPEPGELLRINERIGEFCGLLSCVDAHMLVQFSQHKQAATLTLISFAWLHEMARSGCRVVCL